MTDMIGKRVEIHPRYDAWMRGDRYGEVMRVGRPLNGRERVHVRLDKSGKARSFPTDELRFV